MIIIFWIVEFPGGPRRGGCSVQRRPREVCSTSHSLLLFNFSQYCCFFPFLQLYSAEKTIERLNNNNEADARSGTLGTIEEGACWKCKLLMSAFMNSTESQLVVFVLIFHTFPSLAHFAGTVTSAEPKLRSSLDRKATGASTGPGTGRVQFSALAASVAGRGSLSRSNDSAGGVGSTSYSRGLVPLTSPVKTEEPSKLLQSERAK